MIAPAALQVPVPADIFDKYPAEQAKQAILFEQEKALEVAYKRMPEEHQTAFMAFVQQPYSGWKWTDCRCHSNEWLYTRQSDARRMFVQ